MLTEAGIDDVVVTGTIQGLRRRPRWWGFDLVEMAPSGDSPAATLRCVVFARHMASIEAALTATDTAARRRGGGDRDRHPRREPALG